jgi:hypothetical protein
MFCEFSELDLKTGEKTRVLTFQADSPREAAESALYTAQLSNGRAVLGPTGLVVYPGGRNGNLVWVYSSCEVPYKLGYGPEESK